MTSSAGFFRIFALESEVSRTTPLLDICNWMDVFRGLTPIFKLISLKKAVLHRGLMRSPYIFSFIALILFTGRSNADSFIIDSSHTLPVFEVNHLGFSTQRGRFNETQGTIELDRKTKTGQVRFSIGANSIDMGQPKWDEHMKSADFFNVAQFPEITFVSSQFDFDGEVPVAAEGTLTLLGVSRPVRLAIQSFTCGDNPIVKKAVCAANIETRIRRSDFGMTKYLPGISDEVRIVVPVEAFKTQSQADGVPPSNAR